VQSKHTSHHLMRKSRSKPGRNKERTMDQKEVNEIMRLARNAVHTEYRSPIIDDPEVNQLWRDLFDCVMRIAADRANRVLKAHEEGIL